MEGTRWGVALRHAAQAWGIGPEAFWRLSVMEWRALAGSDPGAPTRDELEGLMRRFPDALPVKENGHEG